MFDDLSHFFAIEPRSEVMDSIVLDAAEALHQKSVRLGDFPATLDTALYDEVKRHYGDLPEILYVEMIPIQGNKGKGKNWTKGEDLHRFM